VKLIPAIGFTRCRSAPVHTKPSIVVSVYPLLRYIVPLLSLGLVATFAVGCDWVKKETPETAQVLVDGASDAQARVITSTDFSVQTDADGTLQVARLFQADTLEVAPPFEREYRIRTTRRFFARMILPEETASPVRLRAAIDGAVRYDQRGGSSDSTLQFIYIYSNTTANPGSTF